MKKLFNKIPNKICKIVIAVVLLIIICLLAIIAIIEPKYYSLSLRKFNNPIYDNYDFITIGSIVDSYKKGAISFQVKAILTLNIYKDDEKNMDLMPNGFHYLKIYVGSVSSKRLLHTYKINEGPNMIINDDEDNNLVNVLLKNQNNIQFCFTEKEDSKEEICYEVVLTRQKDIY